MSLSLKINNEIFFVDALLHPPHTTLNTFIRDQAQLTATKFMCLEGGCGVCVVAVRRRHPSTGVMETFSVNSCLALLGMCRDWEIFTCEGIGSERKGYHPLQKQLAALNGTQCGYCSPGFVMTMWSLLESKENSISMLEVENAFGGNICRCTGYRPILEAMKSFASDSTFTLLPDVQDIEDLSAKMCLNSENKSECNFREKFSHKIAYDDGSSWHRPTNFDELFEAMKNVPSNEEFMLVGGNTAHGVYRRSPGLKHFIDINNITDLKQHSMESGKLTLGAALTLTEATEIFKSASERDGFQFCRSLSEHFELIANPPVRNMGTLAGNILLKKSHPDFVSDVFVLFECLDVTVVIRSDVKNKEKVKLREFMNLKSEKMIITAFEVAAYPEEMFIFKSYKIMQRAENAHAYVNAAFLLELQPGSSEIKSARLCFGGIRPDFVHASKIESLLVGKVYHDDKVISELFTQMPETLQPDAKLPDASPEYRKLLACSLLYRFLLSIAPVDKVKPEFRSGGENLKRPLSSGSQDYETNKDVYPMSEAVRKIEGLWQCAGEAKYTNDQITGRDTGYCAFVTATKVGATIQEIDPSKALALKGFLAFYAAKDIPGENVSYDKTMFLGAEEEELFCSGVVKFYGQPLGVVVASTADLAEHAAKLVKVFYTNTKGQREVITSIEDAIGPKLLNSSRKNNQLTNNSDISDEGILKLGSQYHFTLEPQTTVALPIESGLEIWGATQYMDHMQAVIARALAMNASQVQLKLRRLGGGFGAKWSQGNRVACAAALAAIKLKRPIRFVQSIESMMHSNGKRWACYSEYSFKIEKTGKILSLENKFYEDAGFSLNENPIEGFTKPAAKNCYDLQNPSFQLEGEPVRTDAPSSAIFRAPGSLEAIAMMENIIEHLAFEAKIDPADARKVNIKADNKMKQLLPEFLESTEYLARKKQIEEQNNKSRWRKSGLGLAIMEFPINYLYPYPATVVIYHIDGTVVVTHGGVEMGQGLNTKVAQVAAFTLGIPLETVKIEANTSINGANAKGTGGSIGSEVTCSVVRKACKTLNERLKPIKDSLGSKASWREIIAKAYEKSINLIANEMFEQDDLKSYKVYGLALTEVEIDVLTGNLLINRVDIFEDAGVSLNPAIDVGQIEGAFVMGLGYWLTEQLINDRQTGRLLTDRTWNYKPPGAKDIPIDFRIRLSKNDPNPAGFMRSKTAGEPPICLSISVIFAIRQAMESARKDAGLERKWLRLGAPTTAEVIALNCGTDVSSFSLQ